MTLLQHYQSSLYLTTVVTTGLGFWVLRRDLGNRVARIFGIYVLAVAFWSWCQVQVGIAANPTVSLMWARTMFCAVITFPLLLTHVVSALLSIDQRRVCQVGWFVVIGFLPFLPTPWFLHEGGPVGFLPTFVRGGPLFLPFNVVWLGWIVYDLLLIVRYKHSNGGGPSKEQVRIFFTAFLFGYAMAVANYLYFYGIQLPILQPFACYGVPIAFLVLAYGIFAYGLFDIHIVIRKSLIYSLLVTLLTAGYFGLVYGIEHACQLAFGYHSVWVSLAAFAAMALVFQPLKLVIQRVVDHLVFRAPQLELARRLELLEQEVREADKAKAVNRLAAGIAHEIKNPLTALQTFLDYLPDRAHDPQFLSRFQQVVGQEVRRLRELARGLLDFAKPTPACRTVVDVREILNHVAALARPDLLEKGITVECRYQHNGAVLLGDVGQLNQVFLNLILNARDAMVRGGVLTVTTRTTPRVLEVLIADTGHGIAPADLPHLFEPFFTRKPTGTGLGLSIVQQILHDHGGTIAVASPPGRGTTFTVRLPLGSAEATS